MKYPDVVVLNDMHPSDFPGAATIALNHAKYLSDDLVVEFWHTSTRRTPKNKNGNLVVRCFYRNQIIDHFIRKTILTRIFWEFLPSFLSIKIIILLFIKRPKIVWLNQIGVRIPRTIVIVLWVLNIRQIQTFHDFGVIAPRKLYPTNLNSSGVSVLSKNILVNKFYLLRSRYLIRLSSLNHINVCISQMQADILQQTGVRKIKIVPNGIDQCVCDYSPTFLHKAKTVLFAGRVTGKGFERTCKIIKDNPNWTLLAAGSADLQDIGLRYLDQIQFKYLGFMNSETLFSEIHGVDFVSVLSECFDVYPTIALEAFMHKSSVISSSTTGVADLIRQTNCGTVLDDSVDYLNLDALKSQISQKPVFPVEVISLRQTGELYKSLFSAALSPVSVKLL